LHSASRSDPRRLGAREEPLLVFVSAEPAKDLAIGVIERMVGALKRGVGAFVEPELSLIGAIHAEGGGGGDRKKDRGRYNAHDVDRRRGAGLRDAGS
jgi:hypothetical protein